MSATAAEPVPLVPRAGRRFTRPTLSTATSAGENLIAHSVRGGLLLMAPVVALGLRTEVVTLLLLAIVLALALVASRRELRQRPRLLLALAEVAVVAAGVALSTESFSPLLICLPAGTLAAALSAGFLGAAASTVLAGSLLLAGSVHGHAEDGNYGQVASQWLLMGIATALLGVRIRQLSDAQPMSDHDRYTEAYQLMAQLRALTGRLPGSLDPQSAAHSLLDRCVDVMRCEFGAVLLHVGGQQLVPLALHGYDRVPWRASLTDSGVIQRAWLSGVPVVDRRPADPHGGRRGSALLVLPMTVDHKRVGVTVLESRRPAAFSQSDVVALAALVADHALPLETAALFDELRIGAAGEERARLAREIHDGIAQDLASVGYELDGLIAGLADPVDVELARRLRCRITALISDLRLSISELRSSIGPGRGLGAALSEYVRSVGTSSATTVHLSLSEGSTRLAADVEVQLLRIAHAVISRTRHRPGARNLWVSLVTDPPFGSLVIEDDGVDHEAGAISRTLDVTGLAIRAESIRATLTVERRVPQGLRVCFTVGGSR